MKLNFLLCLFVAAYFAHAQNDNSDVNPRFWVEELTSEKFAGRGYVENGMDKAAEFIAGEFQKMGVKPFQGSYFQEFSMPINIIKSAKLKLNGQELKYGIDFLVKPNSKSQKFQQKEIYQFDPLEYASSLKFESAFIDFIYRDMAAQTNKHVVFPPHHFEIDSLNQYYKHWPNFYKPEENKNRAVFFFTNQKLTASLSLSQDSISQFIINDKYYSSDLSIDDYLIESEHNNDFKANNILGFIEGEISDSLLVITSHYDHLGKVDETVFPGASDNASGTAFLLSMAQHFAKNKPKYSILFIAFGAEEAGLIGSKYFVQNSPIDLKSIKFLLNFDIMGAGDEGIQIVNSTVFEKEYSILLQINEKQKLLKQIKKRGESCNSDHCPFYELGVPSFFTYTLGGPGHYHDPFDTAESISLAEFDDIQKLFISFIDRL